MTKKRVVVTGMGALTPLGLNVKESWKNILAGKSGVGPVTRFDVSEYASRFGGCIKDYDPAPHISPKEVRKFSDFVQFAVTASAQALDDAKLDLSDEKLMLRTGVAVGSGIGGIHEIETNYAAVLKGGPRRISPFFIPGSIVNMASGLVGIKFGLKGPNYSIVTACTTGTHNIGYAARSITYGEADVMVAGGTEMATCPLGLGGFASMKALSTRNDAPEKASRPWDKDRDGFVLGEGAGVVILESLEHAEKRGAHIYAELVGYGTSCDAFHITQPESTGDGAYRAMENALADAGLTAADIDYVNAHATSTPMGDELELKAIERLFAKANPDIAVSSTKSMTGHLLGAAGSVEAIFSILAMRDNIAPPTINLDHPSVETSINLVPHKAQSKEIKYVLSNSFGFGGTNGTLIFKEI